MTMQTITACIMCAIATPGMMYAVYFLATENNKES